MIHVIKDDPYEENNIYDKNPEIVQEMNILLEQYLSD